MLEARRLKEELSRRLPELLPEALEPAAAAAPGPRAALGLQLRGEGEFGVAVRLASDTPATRLLAERLHEQLPGVDVRHTGAVVALPPRAGPPVPASEAAGQVDRVRPLRPGVSIAHHQVSAGTLGGFVTREGEGTAYLLSNWHVLAGSTEAQVGDPVLQPGPADGGRLPEDQVARLADLVPLTAGVAGTVDAALARVDDAEVDPTYPVGALEGTASVLGSEAVEKVGRTTGVTRGRVTAFELDGVMVDYGPELGQLRFDGQIEVEGSGVGPFSRGGDSGSLVYRPQDQLAVGLLFAGSETGGADGSGLTYLNPVDDVLTALRATLLSLPRPERRWT